MPQIQIFHECPLSIFDKVQAVTDGDYALVHLLDNNDAYADRFAEVASARNGIGSRPFILDNSAYELGESFDTDKFAEWIEALRPDYYVVPDVPGDAEATVIAFEEWCVKYTDLPGKRIGVLQGKTPYEAVACFNYLQKFGADIIGVPFLIGRWLLYRQTTPQELLRERANLLHKIHADCKEHPIHLLGVTLPQEGQHVSQYPWIVSVDTSNPIMHGMFGTRYTEGGVNTKRIELLADLINNDIDVDTEEIIFGNILDFRRFFNRDE